MQRKTRRSLSLLDGRHVYWRLSRAWALKVIDCSNEGMGRCGGACCTGNGFWPGCTGAGQICPFLVDRVGCSLEMNMRPVTCLLFPFVLNSSRTLCLYGRTCLPSSRCYPNYKLGDKPIIERLESCFVALFGLEAMELVYKDLERGKDPVFKVPAHIEQFMLEEKKLSKTGAPYKPRRLY